MKKNILYFLALCVISLSCSKTVPVSLIYSVTDIYNKPLQNVYIPDSGTYSLQVNVNFLQGNTDDSVRLTFRGLPANVWVTPDTFTQKPSFTTSFVFTTNNAAVGSYPISIVAYTPTTGNTTYNFNLVIQPDNCATLFSGALSGSDACSSGGYTFGSTGTAGAGALTINNFGGYGTNTNAYAVFNCDNDSLYIASQNIGNGVTLQGAGTFNANSMVIYYTATNIPSGGNATCTVTYTR